MELRDEIEEILDEESTNKLGKNTSISPEMRLGEYGFTVKKPLRWSEITFPEQSDVSIEVGKKIRIRIETDGLIIIGDAEYRVQMMVLQAYSNYFKENLKQTYEFSEDEVPNKAFPVVYEWMMQSDRESYRVLNKKNLLDVLRASQFLKIEELEAQCWTILKNPQIIKEHEAFNLLVEAQKCGIKIVADLMVDRIVDFFIILVSTSLFLDLNLDVLLMLLCSSSIRINCEQEVFLSAVRWLFHDWNKRNVHAIDVIKCIRFEYIKPNCLTSMGMSDNKENNEVSQLMEISEINKLRTDGLEFSLVYYRSEYRRSAREIKPGMQPARCYVNIHRIYETYNHFLVYLREMRDNIIEQNHTNQSSKAKKLSKVNNKNRKKNQKNNS